MGTSPKSSPQGGKPWLHLLEGKTWPCLEKSCLTCSFSGAAPHTAAGQGFVVPWAATVPQPRHLVSSTEGFWVVCSLLGSVLPACSLTFPCPSGDHFGEPPSAGYSRTEPPGCWRHPGRAVQGPCCDHLSSAGSLLRPPLFHRLLEVQDDSFRWRLPLLPTAEEGCWV